MRVLVLGATGLLGHTVLRVFAKKPGLEITGTLRRSSQAEFFPEPLRSRLEVVSNLEDLTEVSRLFSALRPDVVVNCVALRRMPGQEPDPRRCISVYALLPQRLARLCRASAARLVQVSSDGVFSGRSGNYSENDIPDAEDSYGVAKLLGECTEPHAITIRTSMIGHELGGGTGLLEWFLSQTGQCRCFPRAIFSGLPTVILAEVLRDLVVEHPNLSGLFNVAADPISKCDLLRLVAEVYGKKIVLVPDESLIIDRSLNFSKFARATGFVAPSWRRLVQTMHSNHNPASHV